MANGDGTPIWFELNTADPTRARDFYAAVAGWTIAPSPMAEHGGYLIANADDGDGVAGMMTPPAGAPAYRGWAIYFGTNDVDATVERIKALNGTLHFGPMDIPHVGRFAVVADPQGVVFFVMKGDSPEDSTAFRQTPDHRTHGHGVWIELATPDPAGAFAFYGELFGWEKAGAMPMGAMGEYAFIGTGETNPNCPEGQAMGPGAIMSSTATNAPARWNWYVHVSDIDAAIEAAKTNGGTLIQGPDQIPGGDYAANITDPEGAQVGLVGPRK